MSLIFNNFQEESRNHHATDLIQRKYYVLHPATPDTQTVFAV